jgi:hypothetical protein
MRLEFQAQMKISSEEIKLKFKNQLIKKTEFLQI